MSIKDITNYVRQTPGNTNPSVIQSMVESEIGEYIEEASNEALRKLGVNNIPGEVFIFDGNTEGKLQFPSYPLYKISNKVPDISTFVKLTANMGGVETELTAEYCTIESHENGDFIKVQMSDSLVTVAIIFRDKAAEKYVGLYAICVDGDYLARIEFAETIHPISAKYLPGVCLPVVELTETYLNEIWDSDEGVGCTEGELFEQLEKVFSMGVPWVLRIPVEKGVVTKIMTGEDGTLQGVDCMVYSCTLYDLKFVAARTVFDNIVIWYWAVQGEA